MPSGGLYRELSAATPSVSLYRELSVPSVGLYRELGSAAAAFSATYSYRQHCRARACGTSRHSWWLLYAAYRLQWQHCLPPCRLRPGWRRHSNIEPAVLGNKIDLGLLLPHAHLELAIGGET